MAITTALNVPRNSYVATSAQTVFTVAFEFYTVADVVVYKNGVLMTHDPAPSTSITYSVEGSVNASDSAYEFGAGGTVTFGSGLTVNDSVVILRDVVVERITDFSPAGAFDIVTLNTQLDSLTSMVAERETQSDRSIKLLDTDVTSATLTLPVSATRASKMLSFDSSGHVETTITSSGLSSLSDITADITTVAGIRANVTTVAGISANVTSVAGVSANVTSVAGVTANVTTVAGISANVTTVAGISANVTTVASNVAGVNSFASIYRIASSDPDSSLDEGDLVYNSTDNLLKYYNGSAWVSIQGTATTLDSMTDTTFTSIADGSMMLYDTGASKWIDNVMSGEATMLDTGAVTIANNIIDEANLKISNAPTNGYMLTAQSGNTGGMTWAEAGAVPLTTTALTGTTDELDWSASDIQTHTLTAPTTYTYANVPAVGELELELKTFKTGYDFTSNAYNSDTYDPATQIGTTLGTGFFSTNGLRVYVTQGLKIFSYTMSTAWDVSTASYDSKTITTGVGTAVKALYIGDSGSKLYIIDGASKIWQYPLSTAYDITTIGSLTSSISASTVTSAHSTTQGASGLWLKPDGTALWSVVQKCDDSSDYNVVHWALSTPWAVSSASAVTAKSIHFGVGTAVNHDVDGGVYSIAGSFSPNGDYWVTQNQFTSATIYGASILKCSTPWDLSTASNFYTINMQSLVSTMDAYCFQFTDDGSAIVLADRVSDKLYRWELGSTSKFAVTFPSGTYIPLPHLGGYSSGTANIRLMTANGSANVKSTRLITDI